MAYLQDSFMNHRRKQWLRAIHAIEVQVGTEWYRGYINRKDIEGDTLVIMATFPDIENVACTVTASRLIDVRGEVAAYQQRTIEKNNGQGIMLRITIPIREVTA